MNVNTMSMCQRMAWRILLLAAGFLSYYHSIAQTTTVTSGNWNDGSVWSSGTVPGSATGVLVINPITINSNITITTGTYTFVQFATDLPGGSAYTLTAATSGGILDISAGTTTFEGAATLDNMSLYVRNGATLILGATTIDNQSNIVIESGGTLVINGDLINRNNGTGTFVIGGLVQVNGDYTASVGNVDIGGGGDLFATGTIITTGSSDVFGSTQDCTTGPCSGQNLCSFSNTLSTSSQTLCSGGTPTILNGNAVGGATYAWESSTTSSTSGFGLAVGTNNTQSYTPGSITQTTWFRRKVSKSGCTGITPPVQIAVVSSSGGWIGSTNDWNTASNWCSNTVPTSTTDVTIPAAVGNQPQITAAAQCRDLIITSGAIVTIAGSNALAIYGNLTNNGSFNTNSGSVTLSGGTQQVLSGNPITFNNLTINNTSASLPEVVTSNFYTVSNSLTMTSGRVNLSGFNLTLGTNASSPGSLSYLAGRLYNGNLTRWFNTGTVSLGTPAGLFPIGSSTDYRPFHVDYSSPLSSGGTIRVGHVSAPAASTVAIVDDLPVVRRQDSYWPVSIGNGLSVAGAPFSIRGSGTGFGTVGDVADLRITLINSVAGSPTTNGGSTTNPEVNRISLTQNNLTNNFYIGSVNAAQSPLPVTLTDFTGESVQSFNRLRWRTMSELNFDFFQIQKLVNGEFLNIGHVSGNGTTSVPHEYEFTDQWIENEVSYYRLKIVDLDGYQEYSKVISLERKWVSSVYPNPVKSKEMTVSINENQLPAIGYLLDSSGQKLGAFNLTKSTNQLRLDESIQSGLYIFRIISGANQEIYKLMIE